jgi:hypothetical protein
MPRKRKKTDLAERWNTIRAKCHPATFEIAQLLKESIEAVKRAGHNPPKEVVNEIDANLTARSLEINGHYPDLAQFNTAAFVDQSIFSETVFLAAEDLSGVFEWLHFQRNKIPYKQDLEDAKKGDWDASRRIQRTLADAEQLRCGGGPIMPFKGGNPDHLDMFQTLWNLGIQRLDAEELADFFDKYCPCGKPHYANSVNRYRDRFREALEKTSVQKPRA